MDNLSSEDIKESEIINSLKDDIKGDDTKGLNITGDIVLNNIEQKQPDLIKQDPPLNLKSVGKIYTCELDEILNKRESELKLEQATKIFESLIDWCEEICKDKKKKMEINDPYISGSIINTNGDCYNLIHGDCPIATYGMADNEAYTSLAFSNDKISVNSSKLAALYTGISPISGQSNLNYVSYPGGIPIYKNGILIGAIGIVCEIRQLNEELAILCIESSGYESKCNKQKMHNDIEEFSNCEVILDYKNSSLVQGKNCLLILNSKTKKPICSHTFKTLEQYFYERSISKLVKAACPFCVKEALLH